MKFKDLTGKRFGRLVVIHRAEDRNDRTQWLCKCDCGGERTTSSVCLIKGTTKSCGCLIRIANIEKGKAREIDRTGQISGRLTVLRLHGTRKNSIGKDEKLWMCLCECGNEKVVSSSALSGQVNTRSCGCLVKEGNGILPSGVAALNSLYASYRDHAKRRGYTFSIPRAEFALLTSQNCVYCGCAPSQKSSNRRLNGYYLYNGLDRITSAGGYEIGNVAPCCGVCNVAKNTMEHHEFLEWIRRVYQHSIVQTEAIK